MRDSAPDRYLFGAFKCLMLHFKLPVSPFLAPVLQNNRKVLELQRIKQNSQENFDRLATMN